MSMSSAFTGLGGSVFRLRWALFPILTRAHVSQSLFDWKSINAARAASQNVKSAEYTFKDARDLVVLAVGYVYLQGIADEARIETAEAQVADGTGALRSSQRPGESRHFAGNRRLRAKVELQTRQQQLIQAKNNFAIQKLTVARVIGLAPGQEFEFTDKSPYQPFEGITIDEALRRAYASRSDYQAAMTDVRAAEFSRKAAVAGYLPSLSFNADYGAGGAHPSNGNASIRRAGNPLDSHLSGRQRSRRCFASRRPAPTDTRTPGESPSADRRRSAHRVF